MRVLLHLIHQVPHRLLHRTLHRVQHRVLHRTTTLSIEYDKILCSIKSKVHTALYSEVIFRGLEYSRINY